MLAAVHVSTSFQHAIDQVFGYLPKVLGCLIILVIGYVIARILRSIVVKLLVKAKVDDRLARSDAGRLVDRVSPGGRASRMVGAVVFWLVMLYVLSAAVAELSIPSVTAFMDRVLGYLPDVIAALAIIVVAALLAAGVSTLAKRSLGDSPTAKLAETVGSGVIMAIAVFMALTQLRIASSIVLITYGALLGMLALTGALAFGLGGREVAARMWRDAYDKGQQTRERAQIDLRNAKDSGQQAGTSYAEGGTQATPAGASAAPRPIRPRPPEA